MLKIMLIRHFATPGNEKRQYIGSTDEVLSEKTAFLKRSYPIPEYIIASPMKRCVQIGKADLGYGFIRVSYRFGTFDERV